MKNGSKSSTLSILLIILCIFISAPSSLFLAHESKPSTPDAHPALEIAFDYQRRNGIASNQFAVWIEDPTGSLVKTLYATRFTAMGGWEKRPACLPEWVASSRPDTLSSREINAITGATPVSGRLRYAWDGKDHDGRRVSSGTYRYVVEANLRWDNRVIYGGMIALGGPPQVSRPRPEYFGDADEDRGMISNVAAMYRP